MNKKILCAILIITGVIHSSFGNERINISTYALLQSQKSGGGIGFSFPLYQKNNFFIRNEINSNLYFSNTPLSNANLVTLGDNNNAPLILEMGGAGGFEFIYSRNKSFFIEFGGGAAVKSFLSEESLDTFACGSFKGGYVCITTGAKLYLNKKE